MAVGSRTVKVLITGDASGFKKAVGEVESSAGKLKGKIAGIGAGIGLAAIGKGAFSAVKGFETAALAARDFSVASGLSGEQAARWQESADSVGVEAEVLSKTIGKLTKNLGGNEKKFAALGVTVARTKDGQVDANATFLNAIQVLHDTANPLQRATLGSKLFGQSWKELAPLIEMGAAGISTQLNAVSDAQAKVGTPESIQKAVAFQAAMDNLHDSAQQLQFSFAQGVTPVLTAFATVIQAIPAPVLAMGLTVIGAAVATAKLSAAMSAFSAAGMIGALGPLVAILVLVIAKQKEITDWFARNVGGFKVFEHIPGLGGKRASFTPVGLTAAGQALAGTRAMGGPVMAGAPYLVGERGPEVFVPSRSGQVMANGSSGGGVTITGPVYVQAGDVVQMRRELEREAAKRTRAGR